MKSLLIVLFFFPALVGAQDAGPGILLFQQNNHDFGMIMEYGGKVSHRFILSNTGGQPFVVTNVRSTCGCTTPSWTKEPVAPGEKGFIEVEFDPKGKEGAFNKTIQVQSTAENANMFITISGTVLHPPRPEELHEDIGFLKVKADQVNMGFLYKGTTGTEYLVMENPTDQPVKVEFDSVPEYISLISYPDVLEPGEYGWIEVIFNTNLTDRWDIVLNKIILVLNGTPIEEKKLVLSANIREDFRDYTPEQLSAAPKASFEKDDFELDTITNDRPVRCRIRLSNTGNSDLIIRAVIPSCGCTAAAPKKGILAPGETTTIEAEFNPIGRAKAFRNSITVITNDPVQYKKHIIIRGYIKRKGQLS